MKKVSRFKASSICFIIILLLSMISGCKSQNISGNITEQVTPTLPAGLLPDYSLDNNRTNRNNGGNICEDSRYIFYKNVADVCNLYRLDKKTGEKIKIADAVSNIEGDNSFGSEMVLMNVTEDKVFFTAFDRTKKESVLYSIGKDGSEKTELITHFNNGIVRDGFAYFTIGRSGGGQNLFSDLYKYDIDTGNKTLLVQGFILGVNINESGDKLYYIQRSPIMTVNEYDLRSDVDRVLLTNEHQTKDDMVFINFLNYYNKALYYAEGQFVKKYDLANNAIEILSQAPAQVNAEISSLAVSHLGIFFISRIGTGTSLFSGDTKAAVPLAAVLNASEPRVGISDNHIIITNAISSRAMGYVKAYTIKGEEVDLGF